MSDPIEEVETEAGPVQVVAVAADDGERLDKVLAAHLPTVSRSRLQTLIRDGAVSVAGQPTLDPKRRVKTDDVYDVALPEPEPAEPLPEDIPLTVVYEDKYLIVIDKPAGMVVHPAAGHATGTLVNALLAHCGASLSGIGGVKRPGIVHRLDKDTSGLLVVAKTDAAHQGLAEQFAEHGRDGRLVRRYKAIAWGAPERSSGRIDARLQRSAANRTRIGIARGEAGREAGTRYAVQRIFSSADGRPLASLLELTLETGRTHQIRVHLEHIGHPILGDPVYATRFNASIGRLTPEAQAVLVKLGRQALHAGVLGFEHPVTGKILTFESPLPADMQDLIRALEPKRAEPRVKPETKPKASPRKRGAVRG